MKPRPVLPLLMLAAITSCESMIVYQVEPSQPEYLLHQDMELKVRIANQGTAPVDVPDPSRASNSSPVFAISGPGFREPVLFSNWSAAHPGVPAPPVTEMTLGPGDTWEGELPLSSLVPIQQPGEYRIGSLLALQAQRVRSEDRTFRVAALDPSSVHLGAGLRPFGAGQGELVFLQRAAQSATVYSARFEESDPSNSEVRVTSPVRRASAAGNASDVASPWRNTPFFAELLKWVVWREGRTLKALSDAETEPGSLELPGEVQSLVQPPLKLNAGPVEVLALSAGLRRLWMASVPPQLPSQPVLAWESELPAAPDSITAALGPQAAGSLRHISLVARQESGFDIFHTSYGAGEKPQPFRRIHVDAARLLPEAPLTMLVTGDGTAHVGVLASVGDGKYALVEAKFGPGAETKPTLAPIGGLPGPPLAGAILYTDRDGAIIRRDVVLLLESGVYKATGSGELEPLRGQPVPIRPLLVTPGESESYVLCFTQDRGFYFEPI